MSKYDLGNARMLNALSSIGGRKGRYIRFADFRACKVGDEIRILRDRGDSARCRYSTIGNFSRDGDWSFLPKTAQKDKTYWDRHFPTFVRDFAGS